jgi:putative restriction endonuclease
MKERHRLAGKYTLLENYLLDLPDSKREVTLGFEQIERIINAKLPPSAYEYQQWWENEKEGNHVNGRAWANAGWKVESVDFNRKQARLVRI